MRFFLRNKSKHHKSSEIARRIGADVCKIDVESQEHSLFGEADFRDPIIGLSPEILIENRHRIVACFQKNRNSVFRQVFVELKFQWSERLGRDRQDTFSSQLCRISDCSLDALRPEGSIAGQNLVLWRSRCQVVENNGHHDSSTLETCLAVADFRVGSDVILPSHSRMPPCSDSIEGKPSLSRLSIAARAQGVFTEERPSSVRPSVIEERSRWKSPPNHELETDNLCASRSGSRSARSRWTKPLRGRCHRTLARVAFLFAFEGF